jgi:pimeloyl-[acyl-carrier protein] methyl ester esterase
VSVARSLDGGSVLLLPGWGCGPELLAPLVPAGAVCVGAADWDRARGSDDLPAIAAHAAAQLPGALTVIGWSLGAMVALEVLPALAGRLAALHLVAPCLRFTAGWPERVLARMRRRCATDPGGVLAEFARRMMAPGEERLAPTLRGDRPVEALLAGLDYLATRDLARPAPVRGCRARVVHGEGDLVVPAALSEPVAEALAAARLVLDGAGHAPQLGRATECAEFVGGVGRAR